MHKMMRISKQVTQPMLYEYNLGSYWSHGFIILWSAFTYWATAVAKSIRAFASHVESCVFAIDPSRQNRNWHLQC